MSARPVLKWVGGKSQLVDRLLPVLQVDTAERYFEPFFGGGAVFFAIQPTQAVISDSNRELMQMYRILRDHPDKLIKQLDKLVHSYTVYIEKHHNDCINIKKAFYESIRDLERDPARLAKLSPAARAARLVMLNKTAFNGLHRQNQAGHNNVAFGYHDAPSVFDPANIHACSQALQAADIKTGDFSGITSAAREGDLVYLDPPYDATFAQYTGKGFGDADMARVARTVGKLSERGVRCVVSNADTTAVRQAFSGLWCYQVDVRRNVSAKSSARGVALELVMASYEIDHEAAGLTPVCSPVMRIKPTKASLSPNSNRPTVGTSTRVIGFSASSVAAISSQLADFPRDRLLFLIGTQSDLRPAELVSLERQQLAQAKPGQTLVVQTTKRRARTINIESELHEALKVLPAAGPWLFPSRKGNRHITVQRLHALVKSWAATAGLTGNFGGDSLRKSVRKS